ncbi:DNA polymerase III subunit gamma/tau [Aliiglaciecola litoralis]|uniref:DNA-directed DNA polymerase n=1 Tax=Aliiglaciecola litoralis TaxID=582857 RepID=A0ABP3X302_9ALTE
MAYQVLARKWRPNRFSELVGQEHVVTAISNALDNNRLHHAYLFTGTRGVGKTTIARIFSKSLNCEKGMGANPCGECHTCKEIENGSFVDLLEIDAASRTKVEDTRELLDNVQYKPTRGEYKVYLIDEVHMLSKHSFNALLKTLEEPPPHVKFLLATTDPQKLPVTILSRCLQFNLKALSREQISGQLSFILEQESIPFEPQAIAQLARAAQGSMRDALSLSDQAIAQGNGQVSNAIVTDMLGLMDKNQILKLVHNVFANKAEQVMAQVDDFAQQAISFDQVLVEMMSLLHQVALTQYVPEACKLETVSARAVFQLAKMLPAEQVQLAYQIALQGRKDMASAADARVGLEMTLLRMLAFNPSPLKLSIDETNEISAQGTFTHPAESEQVNSPQELTDQNSKQIDALNAQQQDVIEQAAKLTPEQQSVAAPQSSVPIADEVKDNDVNHADPEMDSSDIGSNLAHNDETHFAFHSSEDDSFNQRESDLADFHQQLPPEQSYHPDVDRPQQVAPVTNEQPSAAGLHTTASLIALKNQLAQKETASEVATDPAKKPEQDFSVNRFKRAQNAPQEPAADATAQPEQQTVTETTTENINPSDNPQSDALNTGVTAESNTDERSQQTNNLEQGTEAQLASSETVDISQSLSSDNSESATSVDMTSNNAAESPPWDTGIQHQGESAKAEPVVMDAEPSHSFDPMAHLNEPIEVEIDFDVPVFLQSGEKVIEAQQLDTWSQLIEQLQLTALTKQLALHSAYQKNGNHVTLKLLDSKPHLDTESARKQLQAALSEKFQDNIELSVEHTKPKNTPFAVQQTINQVRMQHAQHVAHTDENIQRLKSVFAGHILDDSIQPR